MTMIRVGVRSISSSHRQLLRSVCNISLLWQSSFLNHSKAASPSQVACFPVAHFHVSGYWFQQSAARELPEDEYFVELGRRPSDKVLRLADEMISLSVLEVSDVADLLKKKLKINNMPMMGYGMVPGMPMQGAAGGSALQAEEKKPEKMTFDVRLDKYEAAAKIKIIKEVRAFTSLGLKEAKELVEKTPAILKKGVSKEEASQIVDKLKALGATIVME